MLALILMDVVRCFSPDAILTGNSENQRFELSLTPLEKLQGTCKDGDNKQASVVLHYLDAAGVIQNLTSDPVLLNLAEPSVLAYFRPTTAEFAYMRTLRLFSYSFVFGNEISIPGVISMAQIVQLNATACWEDVIIYADRANGNASINVKPVECFISQTVEVFLEYKVGDEYQRMKIQDSGDPGGFESGNYVHESVEFFNISQGHSGAGDFFATYYSNRALSLRIVLEYQQNGQTQKVIGEISRKITSNNCITKLQPRVYYTVNGPVVRLTTFLINTCNLEGDSINGTIIVSNGHEIKEFQQNVEYNDFQITTGFLYRENGSEWMETADRVSYQFYLSVLDGDTVVLEETIAGYALLSCLQRVLPVLKGSEICIVMELLELERCSDLIGRQEDFAFSIYSDPSGNPQDMRYYMMVVSILQMNSSLEEFCFDKNSDFNINFSANYVPGSFDKRLHLLKKYASENDKTLNFYESESESFVSETVDIDDFLTHGVVFGIICCVFVVIMSLIVALLLKKLQ